MPRHHETNPHFGPSHIQDQPFQSPGPRVSHSPQRQNLPGSGISHSPQQPHQPSRPVGPLVTGPRPQDQQNQNQNQPLGSSVSQPQRQDQPTWPLAPLETGQRQPRSSPWLSMPWQSAISPTASEPQRQDQPPSSPGQRTKKPKRQESKRQDKGRQPLGPWGMLPEHHDQHILPSGPRAPLSKEGLPEKVQHSQPHSPQVLQPQHQGQSRPPHSSGAFQPQHQGHHSRPHGLRVPPPRRTKLLTWFLAGFCTIFWIVIILGGLIVLIVYLLFRPHNPQFDVSGVTLNAAYLDMDVLLNADLTVLANFTNPNRKVKVDFSYVVLDLYYGSTLIASQYVEPFSAARNEYKLQDIHLVTSQVRLPVGEIERLKKEVSTNSVVFKIKGVFHARSNLGSLLRYSYHLYGTCVVMVNGPPTGVIRAKKCKTKR